MPIDLMTTAFTACRLFACLPGREALFYQGVLPPHFQKFKALQGGVEHQILSAAIIRRDEVMMWEGSRDLLTRAVKDAALRMRGIYSFELLAFSLQQELVTFNYNELATMLVNTSLRMRPGDEVLIRYSSLHGILRKMVEESWGKVTFLTSVEVVPEGPDALYKLMGRALAKTEDITMPVSLVVTDLSAVPLYDPLCEAQQAALTKLELKLAKMPAGISRDVWIEGVQTLKKVVE